MFVEVIYYMYLHRISKCNFDHNCYKVKDKNSGRLEMNWYIFSEKSSMLGLLDLKTKNADNDGKTRTETTMASYLIFTATSI